MMIHFLFTAFSFFAQLDPVNAMIQEVIKEKAEQQESHPQEKPAEEKVKEAVIYKRAPKNKMPPHPLPHMSQMPHIPHQKPIPLRDLGHFMSHPFRQKPTLPDSAVFPHRPQKKVE